MENKKIVLVIEDEGSLRRALYEKLHSENLVIIEATNGEDGLATALREHPDLILLDIIMPKMDGITMLQKLRKDAWGKDAKVIILTNLSDYDRVAAALDDKVFDYLVKTDIKIEEVVAKVKEKLGLS